MISNVSGYDSSSILLEAAMGLYSESTQLEAEDLTGRAGVTEEAVVVLSTVTATQSRPGPLAAEI